MAQVNSMDVTYQDVTYKQVLLPVWLSSFSYGGKLYRYAINGETGKVGGQRPYSIPKIIACILFVAAIIGGYFYYAEYVENSQMLENDPMIVVEEADFYMDMPNWLVV